MKHTTHEDDPRLTEFIARLGRLNRSQKARERYGRSVMFFHEAGIRKYPQWRRYCNALVKLGADPQIADLLVAMPAGIDLVPLLYRNRAALADVVSRKTRRARAEALRQVAEMLPAGHTVQ